MNNNRNKLIKDIENLLSQNNPFYKGKAINVQNQNSINVRLENKKRDLILAESLNNVTIGDVTVVQDTKTKKYYCWTADLNLVKKSNKPNFRKNRIRPVEESVYPFKILFLVENEENDKTEIYLGGDRKTPVKIYEVPLNNNITINNVIGSNLGKKEKDWVAFIKYYDSSLLVNFEGENAFNGSTVISFLNPTETVTHGITDGLGDRPYQTNVMYRGNDLANINPRFFANISNLPPFPSGFSSKTNDILHDPFTSNLEFIRAFGEGETYEGWTELDLYVSSGLENDPVRLLDEIPVLEDDLLNSDYNFSLTHNNVRNYLNPFTNNNSFQEIIESEDKDLNDFNITRYKGFLEGDNTNIKFDPYAFFLTAESFNYLAPSFRFNYENTGYVYDTYPDIRGTLFNFIDKFISPFDQTNNGSSYPRHLIETNSYNVNNKPNNYYLNLGLTYNNLKWNEFRLIIDSKYSIDFDYDNYYQLVTQSFDNTTIPLVEIQFDNYELNNLNFSGSYSYLTGKHFRFYQLYDNPPDNIFYRNLNLKKINGSVNISSINQEANINYLQYIDEGSTIPLVDNYWSNYNNSKTRYKLNIPYIYFKGKTSYIIATFKTDLKLSTSSPIEFYEETYKLYWNNTIIEITDLGELKTPIIINNSFVDTLNIISWYDTLVDNYIYRVIENSKIDEVINKDVNLSVIKYKINNDGVIVKVSTKTYPALSLKNNNGYVWSANFYPPDNSF